MICILQLTVKPHHLFKRDGDDIYADVPVSFVDAVLGGKIQVPTLDNMVTMTLPSGTDSGKKFKLKGKGIPEQKDRNKRRRICSDKNYRSKNNKCKDKGSAARDRKGV